MVDAFEEPNRPVIAKCQACGFEIHGPLLRIAIETAYPCKECGGIGVFGIWDKEEAKK